MGKGIFVTGTDTGVGKTFVCAGMAAALKRRGIDVGVMKPVESGCYREKWKLIPEDAMILREAAGVDDDIKLVNPYSLESPLAPAIAAELEGVEINMEVIREAYETIQARHQLTIVEGAGGLLVPLTRRLVMADIPKTLGIPLLIVTTSGLGAINHTLLTVYYADRENIDILGVIMKAVTEPRALADLSNPGAVKRWSPVPFLGMIPYLRVYRREAMADAVESNLDLSPIVNLLAAK